MCLCACEYVSVVLHTDYTTEHRFIYLHVFSWMYYCRIICLFIHTCKIFGFLAVDVCACVCDIFIARGWKQYVVYKARHGWKNGILISLRELCLPPSTPHQQKTQSPSRPSITPKPHSTFLLA